MNDLFEETEASAPPRLDEDQLLHLAGRWAPDAQVRLERLLPSYRDLNALIRVVDADKGANTALVLKVANPDQPLPLISAENQLLQHLVRSGEIPVPGLLSTMDDENIVEVEDDARRPCLARSISLLPGIPLANCIKSDQLLQALGATLGKMTSALEDFDSSALHRPLLWDNDRGRTVVEENLPAVADPEHRRILETLLSDLGPWLSLEKLPKSIIHGDANDYNILVEPNPRASDHAERFEPSTITAILDFGDAHYSTTINDLAIALAYCLFGPTRRHFDDPVAAVLPLVSSYHRHRPVSEAELQTLFPRAMLRLGVSVALSARQRRGESATEYRTITESFAWKILHRFFPRDQSSAERRATFRQIEWRLRHACDFEPCTGCSESTVALQKMPKTAVFPVLGEAQPDYRLIDLSFGAASLVGQDPADQDALTRTISRVLGYDLGTAGTRKKNDPVGWGRYSEPRALYVGEQFRSEASWGAKEPRTIHLGVDLFAPPGTRVFAPLDGVIHSFADNAIGNDYGPTIILEHKNEGRRLLTLYGHLSRESLEGLSVGQAVAAGEAIAELGTDQVNGGWAPHLHFQILLDDLGLEGNYPGVCEASQLAVWQSTCPDPNLLLRWDGEAARQATASALVDSAEILARREKVLAPSLSLSYDRPLQITHGRGQYLFENNGHRHLDLVNNVSHVGHCHPRVVEACYRQAATLNTNSRYLHSNILDYSERLLATVPSPSATDGENDPLEVCFFVNSGSEANDLALRIARTATGRNSILCVDGAYHGNLSSTVDVSPYKHDGPGGSGTPEHVYKLEMPDTFRGEFREQPGASTAGERFTRNMEEAVANAMNSKRPPAALIIESILSCGGQVVLPEGYLRRAFAAVRAHGGLCISDEVQVGFGRVGSHFWAFEEHGVVPDILTLGKPIGNGHPLAAVLTTRRIAEAFANGMEYFNTYGGNPVSCAVGLAVLDVIEEEGLQQRALILGERFLHGLCSLQEDYESIGDVRGAGLFLGFELVTDRATREPDAALAWYLVQWMRERGFLLSTDGPQHNVIKIKPPMVLNKNDVDQTLNALRDFFATVVRPGQHFS